ncbi:uncharacterized protein LACBIDRAFT_317209 [Laccaria bicolor S238N-H82]|uniref:Dolichyl-diphosphooligosaccharide--protein glycosyltransferase subunit 4 n=1 Tax=Laccaria bicolor (strain S238N-H82 / ATCC MYA-4686) TaxID=486041 RepID=B0D4N7_LACBS|nr:uncharacterized protein LACBIDRAFT_317209 [Laccaria bicolor S238N-H82]EDR10595.1 predicted protein [Laccaria bicolor S238N-H82]|eukprot:XP_001879045.1 predicted protein [Laccaria bicolor S238N-H82]
MISHNTLYNLANSLGLLAMVTVVGYHFVAVNARYLEKSKKQYIYVLCTISASTSNELVYPITSSTVPHNSSSVSSPCPVSSFSKYPLDVSSSSVSPSSVSSTFLC